MCKKHCTGCSKCNSSSDLASTIAKVAESTALSPYYSTPRRQGLDGDYAKWKGGTKPTPVASPIQEAFVNAVIKVKK